jgi:hypothetical protein
MTAGARARRPTVAAATRQVPRLVGQLHEQFPQFSLFRVPCRRQLLASRMRPFALRRMEFRALREGVLRFLDGHRFSRDDTLCHANRVLAQPVSNGTLINGSDRLWRNIQAPLTRA